MTEHDPNFEVAKQLARRMLGVVKAGQCDSAQARYFHQGYWTVDYAQAGGSGTISVKLRTGGDRGQEEREITLLAASVDALPEILGPENSAADLEAQRDTLIHEVLLTIETLTRGDELPAYDAQEMLAAVKTLTTTKDRPTYAGAMNTLRALVEDATERAHLPPDPNPLQATIDRLADVVERMRQGQLA